MREWHDRVSELTLAAKDVVAQRCGSAPDYTWMTGISNGGYLTRWQLENRPELFNGGVDWEATLMTADGPNIFTYLRRPSGSTRRPWSTRTGCCRSTPTPTSTPG